MQLDFDKKILIHQNLCLASKVAQLTARNNQLEAQVLQSKASQQSKHMQSESDAELEQLKHQNSILKQRLTLLSSYQTSSIQKVINSNQHLCYCGGLNIAFYSKKLEEIKTLQQKRLSQLLNQPTAKIPAQSPSNEANQAVPNSELQASLVIQNKLLAQRIGKLQKKVAQCRLNHKFEFTTITNSSVYSQLKSHCKNLLSFSSQLLSKQRNLQTHLQTIEEERKKQIIQLINKFSFPQSKFKCQDWIMKSQLSLKLDSIEQRIKQFTDNLDELKDEIKKHTKTYNNCKSAVLRICQNLSQDIIYERGVVGHIHGVISDWLNSPNAVNFLRFKRVQPEQTKRHWQGYVRLFRELCEENEAVRQQMGYQQVVLSHRKPRKIIKRQLQKYQSAVNQLQNKFNQIRSSLIATEFRLGRTNAEVFFKYSKQCGKRQDLQHVVDSFKRNIPLYNDLADQTATLNNLIQIEKLESRERQGAFLGEIKSLRTQLQEKHKLLQHYEQSFKKKFEQANKFKLQYQKCLQQAQSKLRGECSEAEARLKLEVQGLLKKITCTCGRGHEANMLLACKHIFCRTCVEALIKTRKRDCPLCRHKFSEASVTQFKYN